jgi:hypothetical protein
MLSRAVRCRDHGKQDTIRQDIQTGSPQRTKSQGAAPTYCSTLALQKWVQARKRGSAQDARSTKFACIDTASSPSQLNTTWKHLHNLQHVTPSPPTATAVLQQQQPACCTTGSADQHPSRTCQPSSIMIQRGCSPACLKLSSPPMMPCAATSVYKASQLHQPSLLATSGSCFSQRGLAPAVAQNRCSLRTLSYDRFHPHAMHHKVVKHATVETSMWRIHQPQTVSRNVALTAEYLPTRL